MGLRMHRQVGALRKVLSQQAVGILVRPALPRALRIAKIDVDVGRQCKATMIRKFLAPAPGDAHLSAIRIANVHPPIITSQCVCGRECVRGNYALAREDQILSECSPQCRHIEDRYSSLVGEWVAGALDARTTAGIVGRTLSSAASAVCLGGDCWILTKAIPFKTARLLATLP